MNEHGFYHPENEDDEDGSENSNSYSLEDEQIFQIFGLLPNQLLEIPQLPSDQEFWKNITTPEHLVDIILKCVYSDGSVVILTDKGKKVLYLKNPLDLNLLSGQALYHEAKTVADLVFFSVISLTEEFYEQNPTAREQWLKKLAFYLYRYRKHWPFVTQALKLIPREELFDGEKNVLWLGQPEDLRVKPTEQLKTIRELQKSLTLPNKLDLNP